MAKNLAEVVQQCGWEVDVVMPVPLSPKRKKERGYNQAGLLAQPLAWDLGMEYQRRGLRRVRDTVSQIDLSRQERRTNVAGAFLADEKHVGGKRILLVDDVMTTGSTVNAAAQALVDAGTDEVFVVTLARAGKF